MSKKKVVRGVVGAVDAVRGDLATEKIETNKTARDGLEKKEKEPVECIHEYTNEAFRKAFPEICEALLDKARRGDVQVVKLLLLIGKFGEPKPAEQQGGKSLAEMLMDELKRRQDAREEAIDAAETEESGKTNEAGSKGAQSDGGIKDA